MGNIYRHMKTGLLYKVVGKARNVYSPNTLNVVYKQIYKSTLKGTNISLPVGSLWIREEKDFKDKFKNSSYPI